MTAAILHNKKFKVWFALRGVSSLILPFTILIFFSSAANATTKTASSGNWSNANTWSPSGVPANTDDVVIAGGSTVTVNGSYSCHNLYVGNTTNAATTLQWKNSSAVLTVTGDLQLNPSHVNNAFAINVGAGALHQTGTFSFWAGPGTVSGTFIVSTGSIDFADMPGVTDPHQFIQFNGGGTITFNHPFTINQPNFTFYNGCTVNFNASLTTQVGGPGLNWNGLGTAVFANTDTINTPNNVTFNNVIIAAGAKVNIAQQGGGNIDIAGSFALNTSSTFTLNKNLELDGNITNNGGTFSGGTNTVTLGGTTQNISGSSITWPTLQIGLGSPGGPDVNCTMSNSNTCSNLTFGAGDHSRTLNLGIGTVLNVTSNLTIGQPSQNLKGISLMVNGATCNVTGTLTFTGNSDNTQRICQIAATTGSITIGGAVTWMGGSHAATDIITASTGSITFNSSVDMSKNCASLKLTGAGTINFLGTTAPSFNFGSGSNPVFSVTSGSTTTIANGLIATGPIDFPDGSMTVFNGSGTVTPTQPITFGGVQVNPGKTLTLAGDISLTDNWTNLGTLSAGNHTVHFTGSGTQQVSRPGGETFYNITTSSSTNGSLQLMSDVIISNNLTMTAENINMNSYNLVIGNNAGASLTYTAGYAYGGVWKRWFPAAAITNNSGSYYGLFPLGVSNGEYRPVNITSTSNPTAAGYLMISDSNYLPVGLVNYTDNQGAVIQAISKNKCAITTSGLTGGAYNLNVTFNGLSDTGSLSNLRMATFTAATMGSAGAHVAATGTVGNPTVIRNGLTSSQMQAVWVVGTTNLATTPLRVYYYSCKSGNWNDNSNTCPWSLQQAGPPCSCIPSADGYAVIDSGNTVTITANATVDYVDIMTDGTLQDKHGYTQFNITKNLNIYGSGQFIPKGNWNIYGNANLLGNLTGSGMFNCSGTLSIPKYASYTNTDTGGMTVAGNLNLGGDIYISSGNLAFTGNGKSLSGSGTVHNAGGGRVKITGNQSIASGTYLTIGSDSLNSGIDISGGTTITNNGHIVVKGNITGGSSGDTWINGTNGILEFTGTSFDTGTLNTSTGANTVIYSGKGNQTVITPTGYYYNLVLGNTGTKSWTDSLNIANTLTLQDSAVMDAGAYSLSGINNLVMNGNSELRITRNTSGTYPEFTGTDSLNAGTITITQTSGTASLAPVKFHRLKLNGGGAFDFSDISQIDSDLVLMDSGSIVNNAVLNINHSFIYSTTGTSSLANNISAGSFTITSGALADSGKTISVTGTGGWTNTGGTFNSTGKVKFTGGSAQHISGTHNTSFNNLAISNTGGVTIDSGITSLVAGNLELDSGILHTSTSGVLRILHGATTSGSTTNCFVDGPVTKVGNDTFTFPAGNGSKRGQVSISGIIDSTTEVTAQFFRSSYSDLHSMGDPTINYIVPSEYWLVERTITTDSLKLTLNWDDAEDVMVNNCKDFSIVHYKNGHWVKEPSGSIGGACSGTGAGGMQTTGYVTSFSPFGFGNGGEALPIKLVAFNAQPQGKTVTTTWSTELEINNAFFNVERSSDGNNFFDLGMVPGAGNSTQLLNYEWPDKNPLSGLSYYRLKQTDNNGNFSYSDIEAVYMGVVPSVSVYPNPATDNLFLSVSNLTNDVNINIYNLLGNEVFSGKVDGGNDGQNRIYTIPTSGIMPAGIYFVKVAGGQIDLNEKIIIK